MRSDQVLGDRAATIEDPRAIGSPARQARSSNSGGNIDEELVQLIRFKNACSAADRVVSGADDMLQTVRAKKR